MLQSNKIMNLTILYGSATGNAEHIAKDLGESINEKKLSSCAFTSATVLEMDQFKRKKLFESWSSPPEDDNYTKHALVVVCSTTGNGDAPENAGRFVRFIKRKPPTTLSGAPMEHVAYAVLVAQIACLIVASISPQFAQRSVTKIVRLVPSCIPIAIG